MFKLIGQLIFQLALMFVSFNLMAQDQLSGVVAEESDKGKLIPLYGVNVYWQGTTIGTSTDTNGVFRINDDHTNHRLIFSYVGYKNDTVMINNHQDLMIVLKDARLIDEVEIVYRQKATSLSFMDPKYTEVLNEKELFKAACCNLSESFETNASVDASYADAVSGTRQIQMLGLAGIYTQITTENIPSNRGLATIYSLTYTPGAWMDNISISKGTGSVVNGYESITGQINTELRKPDVEEHVFVNLYGNQSGRTEANTDFKIHLNEKWSTSFLLHGRSLQTKNDVNDDGFLDMPLNETFVGMNRWKYNGVNGIHGQFGVKYIDVKNKGGQLDHDFNESPFEQATWGNKFNTKRIESFGKMGYVFPRRKYASVGLQVMAINHDHDAYFGKREYLGNEENYYANLIYQNIIGNSNHQYKVGLSYMYDDLNETFDSVNYVRKESVPGAFFEYTFNYTDRLTAVAGIRVDDHNLFGVFVSPRFHVRYGLTKKTVVRLSAGMGTRVANILAENSAYMASSRDFIIPSTEKAFGLSPEKAMNFGLSVNQSFKLDYRDGDIILDFFRTEFLEQAVVDLDDSPQQVNFHNLNNGRSYANSFQVQVIYELMRRLDIKLAYRLYDVRTDYNSGLLTKPMLAREKGFVNLSYETRLNSKFGQWKFDLTQQIIGSQRLPNTTPNPEEYELTEYSPAYGLMSAQITRVFNKQFELYVGGENLTDFTQDKPILGADNPYGSYFDASMVWAPIFGRMVYAGLRFKIE